MRNPTGGIRDHAEGRWRIVWFVDERVQKDQTSTKNIQLWNLPSRKRKEHMVKLGALPPNPRDLAR